MSYNPKEGPEEQPEDDGNTEEVFTLFSFLRMLGIPISGNTIDEVIDNMIDAGATPWTPEGDGDDKENNDDTSGLIDQDKQ